MSKVENEEELCGQRKLLDAVFKPEADVQLLLVSEEEVPPQQQELRPSLDQEDPPEPPYIKEEWSPGLDQRGSPIKEEQEELWTSQEGKQLQGLEAVDLTKFTFTPVPVKSEQDDEEKPQSSQLHQRLTEEMESESDGEDCGGPEPARNSDPERHLQPDTDKTSDSSETDDSCDWVESGLNPLQNNEVFTLSGRDMQCGRTPFPLKKAFGFFLSALNSPPESLLTIGAGPRADLTIRAHL
ncbi:uncharacterized protein LOC119907017 isoform X2 [Micropterus salmoides]|uniref:uncharacterized protein LOC119907017 isoform X2 n=1 Tax=Micropterus salmoides TaxID=27706 RepID=UPI0018EE06CC|nr:uncharacterized protein LOC119907017 isoform X2 [Micropterus salmoides]